MRLLDKQEYDSDRKFVYVSFMINDETVYTRSHCHQAPPLGWGLLDSFPSPSLASSSFLPAAAAAECAGTPDILSACEHIQLASLPLHTLIGNRHMC
jgi:hypothetical protein